MRAHKQAVRPFAEGRFRFEHAGPFVRGKPFAGQRRFVDGIVPHWGAAERQQAAELYLILARLGGEALVGRAPELAADTFWPGLSY